MGGTVSCGSRRGAGTATRCNAGVSPSYLLPYLQSREAAVSQREDQLLAAEHGLAYAQQQAQQATEAAEQREAAAAAAATAARAAETLAREREVAADRSAKEVRLQWYPFNIVDTH